MFGREADLELSKTNAALALAFVSHAASQVVGAPQEGGELDLTPVYLANQKELPRMAAGMA
jgi:hypothetical protein